MPAIHNRRRLPLTRRIQVPENVLGQEREHPVAGREKAEPNGHQVPAEHERAVPRILRRLLHQLQIELVTQRRVRPALGHDLQTHQAPVP